MTVIRFKCEEDSFVINLESDVRPCVGDMVLFENREYEIVKVIWCLEEPPAQCGILAYIKRK